MLPLPGIDSLPIGSVLEDSGSRNLESAAAGFVGSSARVGWHSEAGDNDVGNRDNMGVAKPEEESLRISSSERCNQTRPMGPGDDASVLYAEGLDHIDYSEPYVGRRTLAFEAFDLVRAESFNEEEYIARMEARDEFNKVPHLRWRTARAMHVAACAMGLTEEEAVEWRDGRLTERQAEMDRIAEARREREERTGRKKVGWRGMLELRGR